MWGTFNCNLIELVGMRLVTLKLCPKSTISFLVWFIHSVTQANNKWCIYATRKKDETKDNDFKDAAGLCLPLIHAALADIEKGTFLKGCLLNVGVPSSPAANKVIL